MDDYYDQSTLGIPGKLVNTVEPPISDTWNADTSKIRTSFKLLIDLLIWNDLLILKDEEKSQRRNNLESLGSPAVKYPLYNPQKR